MGLFSKINNVGLMDVIRCDEPSYLIWKWHPESESRGKNNRENAIRWGSSLSVKKGSVAVFVYPQSDGSQMEFIEGPYEGIIETKNFPILSSIIGMAYAGKSPFQAEVYFINLAQIIQLRFAVPYFDVFDPRFLDFGVPVAVRGTISFKISDYRNFINLHRLDTFTVDDLQNQVKDAVRRYVKGIVANAPEENGIPVIQLERKIDIINELAESRIKKRLSDEFGIAVSSVDIAVIDIDKSSEGYQQLKEVTKDLTSATLQAQNEVKIKEMRDSQKLGIFERAGRAFVDIKESAYARHKQTQSTNFAAYQTEAQEHVGVSGAHGLGMMGATGGGNLAGGSMNPAAMMAGMAVGSAIGNNIVGSMNNVMNNSSQVQTSPIVPPPITNVLYHVAVNGKPTGPYDLASLKRMVQTGDFKEDSLVWTSGMASWQKAIEVNDLKCLFADLSSIPAGSMPGMPPIPGDD